MVTKAKGSRKGRKYGRSLRKANARMKPCSLFVRGKISAEEYFKQTKLGRKS